MKSEELQLISVSKRRAPSEREVFGYLGNKILYWGREVDASEISVDRAKKIIRKATIILLLIILGLGILSLGYQIYLSQDILFSNPVGILFPTSIFLRIFYFGLLCGLFLIYETVRPKLLRKPVMDQIYNLQPKPAPSLLAAEDLAKVGHHDKINIADSFDQASQEIIAEAFKLAQKYQHAQIEPIDFLIACLTEDSKISTVIYRLGLSNEQLPSRISAVMAHYPGQSVAVFSEENRLMMIKAYKTAYDHRLEFITPVEIFYQAVMGDDRLKEMFYDLGVEEADLTNAIEWLRINERLVQRYNRYRASAGLRSKSGIDRAMTSMATQFLNTIAEDLTRSAQLGYLGLGVNRSSEIEEIFRIYETRSKNILLTGAAGVGKTALIDMLAERIVGDDVPAFLKEKRVLSISVANLLAGSSVAQAQQRLLQALAEAVQGRNVIVAIENVHELLGIGTGQGMDLSGVLAEVLSKNLFYFIATTEPQYLSALESSAISNVVQTVKVEEMDENTAIQVLESKVLATENAQGVVFSYQALKKIVEHSVRYIHEQFLPQKALQIMDESAVYVKNKKGANQTVLPADIADFLTQKLRIPISEATAGESELLLNLEEKLHERIVGQDEAVKVVSTALRRARTQLRDVKRPIASFLFLGPTGVGKTELAKTIAEVYFHSESNMIRLDMSEYQTQTDVYKLIGSRTGEERGLLTEQVRKNPFSIVLLDEAEKAYPEILDLFLQVMEDGRLTDARGFTVDFTNTIIIMTSNAGTDFIQQGMQAGQPTETIKEELMKSVLPQHFRPEFLNRFDAIVVFKPLSIEQIRAITKLMLAKLAANLEQKGIYFEASEGAIDELAQNGFDPIYGARPLRRVVQEEVDNALANFLLQGKIGRRDKVILEPGGVIRLEKAREL